MFRLNHKELKNSFKKVKILAELNKASVKALLMEQLENSICLKYSDGKRSLIELLPITNHEEDIEIGVELSESLVIPLTHLENFLKLLETSSSDMFVSDIEIEVFEEKKVLEMRATKLLRVAGEEEEEFKTISKFERQIPYELPSSSLKYGILTRFDYAKMLREPEDGLFDTYKKSFLVSMLTTLDDEKATTIISSKKTNIDGSVGAGFVVGALHSTIVPNEFCLNGGFTLNKVNFPIVKIIEAFGIEENGSDEVIVYRDGEQFVTVLGMDKKYAVQFQLANASKADMMTMELMTSINFDCNLAFVFVALKDIVASLANQHPDDNLLMSFRETEDGLLVSEVTTSGSKISSKDLIELQIENSALLSDEVKELLKELQLKISLKAFLSSLSKLKTDYVALSYIRDESKNNLNILRIAEILGITEEKEVQGGLQVGVSCFITYAHK